MFPFISDIRRVAATRKLEENIEAQEKRLREKDIERLQIPGSSFVFERPDVGSLMEEWIRDAASLEDADEAVRLEFPVGFKPD